ncbi:hypothetical protein [Mesorhizobium sp.]|uniref:hypothetical protein n=1 Tax=Mesorhizobium sp. TaxID=1871066 RepID=UPI000FE4F70E|nr:hypothetical protein [Mesorhizobium sp.]RWP02738.1 MAG: hypothetical protein EOQ99_22945 [Mesorhizobium sp.]
MSNVSFQTQLFPNASNIGGGGDLSALALLLQIDRYKNLQDQVRGEFGDMQKRNDALKTANSALAALRANRPADDKKPKEYGTFVDAQGETQYVYQWMLDNGMPIDADSKAQNESAGAQSKFDAAISNLKARIDTANSDSQMALIRLQSLMDKLNQCAELASNLLSKDGKAKENIIGNIR